MTKEDPTDILQIVGLLEYSKALENFDILLKTCDPDELAAIDEIVKGSPELAIYTNLSRALEKAPSSLSEPAMQAQRRHSFAWVVALARIEVGAMLAGFADTRQPFVFVQPTKYEIDEYNELLLDGLRTHYWALVNDAELRSVTRQGATSRRLLAYFRRALLAQRFAEAVGQFLGADMNGQQRAEMVSWSKKISDLKKGLASNVEQRLSMLTATQTERGTSTTYGPAKK